MLYFLFGFNWRLSRYQVRTGSGLPGAISHLNVADFGATILVSFSGVNSSGGVPTKKTLVTISSHQLTT